MGSSTRDWAGLPAHIVDLIVSKLGLLSDYYSFFAVCSNWRNLNPSGNNFLDILKVSRKEVPMLIITTEGKGDRIRGLYNVLNKITYDILLPLPYKHRFIGSSHGWLICVNKNLVITLLNPFNKACISLSVFKDPSQVFGVVWSSEDIVDYYLQKAILTSDPRTSPNNFEVVVIYDGLSKLAYYKSGHRSWNLIKLEPRTRYFSMDIISYKGCIYSVTHEGELLQIDFERGIVKTVVPINTEEEADGFYLVTSKDGELLLVKRTWDGHKRGDLEFMKTYEFEVFGLTQSANEEFATWDEIKDIGEQALFVGPSNHSTSVSTIECSKFLRNSIYYTPQDYVLSPTYKYMGVDEDSGIFRLEDQNFHTYMDPSEKFVQPPVWFVPNLN